MVIGGVMYIPANLDMSDLSNDKLITKPRFWLPILLAILLALFRMGNDSAFVLTIDQWTIWLSAYWPALADWMARSAFPAVTGWWFSLLAILCPYYVFIISCHKQYEERMVNKWLASGVKRHFYPLLLIFMACCLSALFFWLALPVEKQCRFDCVHEYPIIQTIYGLCLLLSMGFLWSMVFFWLKNFSPIHLTYIDSINKEHNP